MFDDLVKKVQKQLGLQPSSSQPPGFTAGRGHRLGTAAEAEAQRQAKVAAAAASRAAVGPATSSAHEAGPSRGASSSAAAAPRGRPAGGGVPPPDRGVVAAQTAAVKETPPLTGAAVLLATNADGGAAAARLLARVLHNVVADPTNDKFRSLRLSNPAVTASVVESAGGLELLQQAGFLIRFEEPGTGQPGGGEQAVEGYATLELPTDETERASQMEAVRAALECLSPLLPAAASTESVSARANAATMAHPPKTEAGAGVTSAGIPTVVWLPSASCAAALEDLPDAFFERTAAEVAAEAAQRRSQAEAASVVALRSSKQRAPEPPPGASQRGSAVLRVRMTDGTLLQGRFKGSASVQDVYAWVADSLAQPHRTFVVQAPRLGGHASAALAQAGRTTLAEAGLCPSAVLTLRWGEDEGRVEGPVLRSDLMAQAVPLE
jgi:UBX domain-containing protein 6